MCFIYFKKKEKNVFYNHCFEQKEVCFRKENSFIYFYPQISHYFYEIRLVNGHFIALLFSFLSPFASKYLFCTGGFCSFQMAMMKV